ncbi:MAG: PepSY domain-containing protein [Aquabacterium sp.]
MKHTLITLSLMALSAAAPMSVHAHGNVSCKEPVAEWQQREVLEDKLKAAGWKVRIIKIDKGCYEVYGFDDKGKRAEVYFNPKTLERVEEQKKAD